MNTLLDVAPQVNCAPAPLPGTDPTPSGLHLASGAFDYLPEDQRSAVHEAAIAEIVGMIRAKYTEEGERSFAIGKRAFELAQWLKGNSPVYEASDFHALMNRIRDDVRAFVPIKAESIRVADWTRCHVLRELVRGQIADHADALSMFEYLAIVGKALSFSPKDVEGSLNPGWLDMIRDVAFDRATGRRVTRRDFEGRIAAAVRAIADANAKLNPSAEGKTGPESIKARNTAVAKLNREISTALSDGLTAGHITVEGALSIVENVAKHHGIALPSSIGFDPARCTAEDCDLLASTMFQSGKFDEMTRLRDRLNKMVEAAERARSGYQATPATRSIRVA